MPRYKDYDYNQSKLIPVNFDEQILPGTFEYTLSYLIEHEMDLSVFDDRYRNDETGRKAYDPAILLKIVLYAYSRGITSCRAIERCCRENVVFMALSADSQPHFTTIASFISSTDGAVASIFRDVLVVCDTQGLIGREMFAIDGVKLPSNASKEWSGTRAEFKAKVKKVTRAVRRMLAKHRAEDNETPCDGGGGPRRKREEQQIETLRLQAAKLREWLKDNEDKPGKGKQPRKSNITDNDSAKMKTSHGVFQGYNGVATVDAEHQVVVHAQAFGEGQEHDALVPMLEGTREQFEQVQPAPDILSQATVVTDSGFHTEANVQYLYDEGINAYIADNRFRKRDPRFADAARYKPTKAPAREKRKLYTVADFHFADDLSHALCPAGKRLYRSGGNCQTDGYTSVKFKGPQSTCGPCEHRDRCLRHPERTAYRQVSFFKGRSPNAPSSYSAKMKERIDSDEGRSLYSRRLGIVEPVFGNIRTTLRLDRFSLRGKAKVNIQWLLYCLVHNLGKVHRFGYSTA